VRNALAIVMVGAALAACEHTMPFDVETPPALGPYEDGPLARLTFDPGEDRDASGRDSLVVYSHLEAARQDGDWCLRLLPVQGGTLRGTICAGSAEPDGTADALVQASLSPDGTRVAYVHQESPARSWTVRSRTLEVALLAEPGNTRVVVPSGYALPDGRYAYAFRQLRWVDDTRLQVLTGAEILIRDQNLGTLDTVFNPMAVAEIRLSDGQMTLIPGTEGVDLYAPAAGGLWVVRGSLLQFVPDGTDSATMSFGIPGSVLDLAVPDGLPVVLVRTVVDPLAGPVRLVASVDTATGVVDWGQFPFEPTAIAAIPNSRVLLIDGRMGGGTDVWRLDLP